MNSIEPGQQFILRRPYGGKDEPDKFFLVEIGSRKPRRPYSSDNPADQIELKLIAVCNERGVPLRPPIEVFSFFVAPGTLEDSRYYTPIRVEKDVNSGRCAASQRRSGLLRTAPVPGAALREPAANARGTRQ